MKKKACNQIPKMKIYKIRVRLNNFNLNLINIKKIKKKPQIKLKISQFTKIEMKIIMVRCFHNSNRINNYKFRLKNNNYNNKICKLIKLILQMIMRIKKKYRKFQILN